MLFWRVWVVYYELMQLGNSTAWPSSPSPTSSPSWSHQARRLVGLAFLPVEDVETGMEHLWQLSTTLPRDLHEKVDFLLDYFDSIYVSGPIRRGRCAGDPMYGLDVWNVHEATLEHRDRTNNNSETFNAAFKLSVRCSNPGLWLVIDTLQTTFRSIERDILLFNQGQQPDKTGQEDGTHQGQVPEEASAAVSTLQEGRLQYSGLPYWICYYWCRALNM